MTVALLAPTAGAALIAARRVATSPAEIEAREFWLIVLDARAAFAQGRHKAGYAGLCAIRYRLAHAVATRNRAWVRRLKAAEADLEARARAALAEGAAA